MPYRITGARVPNEANQPFQAIEIIDVGTTPPPVYSATVVGTQLFYDNLSAGGSLVPCNVLVPANRIIMVLGLCTSIQGGGTGYNSYGTPAGAFTSNILGNPVTLTRAGTQFNIATAGNNPVWQEPAGAISRVEINVVPATGLFANFSATPTAGAVPLNVAFTDQSYTSDPGGITSWSWDLNGDSVIDSTVQNPNFVYTACGAYNVSLTVTDATNPPHTTNRTGYIQAGITPITPSFTFASIAPGVIQFTDTSAPAPASWAWDLDGDNIVDSTLQNPVWSYPSPCTAVRVTLSVTSSCAGPWSASRSVAFSPLSHTTLLTGGNGLSAVGSGNTFDVQVTNPSGVVICAITMCPYMATPVIGTPLACTVWVTDAAGGFLSNHTNAAVWRQVATGTGTFAGGLFSAPVPVPMVLSSPIYLPMGTFGMAIHMTAGCGVAYTTLTATTTYPGPDMNVMCGNGKGAPFAASANANRAWNGTLHYSTASNGALAGYGYFGTGCAGTLGIPGNTATTLPKLGQTMTTSLTRLNMNAAFHILGFSNTVSLFGPLPLSLTPLGAPGCFGRVSTDSVALVVGAGNTATFSLSVPNNAIYLGMQLYSQALALDTAINALGGVTSDAAALIVGQW